MTGYLNNCYLKNFPVRVFKSFSQDWNNTFSEILLRIFSLSQTKVKLVERLCFASTAIQKCKTPIYGFILKRIVSYLTIFWTLAWAYRHFECRHLIDPEQTFLKMGNQWSSSGHFVSYTLLISELSAFPIILMAGSLWTAIT